MKKWNGNVPQEITHYLVETDGLMEGEWLVTYVCSATGCTHRILEKKNGELRTVENFDPAMLVYRIRHTYPPPAEMELNKVN